MLTNLRQHQLISHNQHIFLSRHSTFKLTQLLETINDWSIALRNRHAVDAVYFDFAKAFDSVSHRKLLHKLTAYGTFATLCSCNITATDNIVYIDLTRAFDKLCP